MKRAKMLEFARLGASKRVEELKAELAEAMAVINKTNGGKLPVLRVRKPMTAKQRRAVGERMTAYWAARRAAAK